MKNPLIFEIKGNSLDDGPGIRTVVFFKGCPLSCVWCHNPESKRPFAELSFDPKECIACDSCLDACVNGALSRDNPCFIDRQLCKLCFDCVNVCPTGALSRIGNPMNIEEIVRIVSKDKPFYKVSGGGVTLSGGEATLYMEFAGQLLKALKAEGIHTLLETCGFFAIDKFEELLLPYIDIIYYDLKIFDSDDHKTYCGVPNQRILSNFLRLHALSRTHGFEIIPRVPLIPGITDSEDNITAIAYFLKSHGVEKYELLAYNPLWHDKAANLGNEPVREGDQTLRNWMSVEKHKRCEEIFQAIMTESNGQGPAAAAQS
jgi:pyruvate formate lyase activating enzyme